LALPVAVGVWFLLWKGTFALIENGVALLGLVTLVFVAGAFKMHPPLGAVAAGMLPSLPRHEGAEYWFIAVSILGALISPYLFYFYSYGAIEDRWDEGHLGINRAVAGVGMGFGCVVSIGVLVVSAAVLHPRGIRVDRYEQAALALTVPFGYWGFLLFAASLGIACFGAALEVALDTAYLTAQSFGWNWGESLRPAQDARFSVVYTVFILLSVVLVLLGVDPLKLTIFSMALTAVILPVVIGPFLILMNDERYVGEHRNGWIGNIVVILCIALAFLLAVVAIPLQFLGG
jgi:Mn2+/Fe2+ NRAMP family transporter